MYTPLFHKDKNYVSILYTYKMFNKIAVCVLCKKTIFYTRTIPNKCQGWNVTRLCLAYQNRNTEII